jgi:site-specific recombinase XerD
MEIADINKSVVERFRAHRHSQLKLTETTINRDLECLRRVLSWAVDEGFLRPSYQPNGAASECRRLQMSRVQKAG